MTDIVARTPVLILAFNRPDRLQNILESVRAGGTQRLYLSLDGPRPGHERDHENCSAVRRLIDQQTWAEHIVVNAFDENQGCGLGVSKGITWFFSQVEEGIILEDDCLPAPTFFRYAADLLGHFRADERVMMITGSDFSGIRRGKRLAANHYSYRFVQHACIWGWATWRRAWKHYDIAMPSWPEAKASGLLESIFPDPDWRRYWERKMDGMHRGRRDTWDYAWMFACLSRHALTVAPTSNQISNIGDGPEATHTGQGNNPLMRLPVSPLDFPLRHPPFMNADVGYDRILQETLRPPKWRRRLRKWGGMLEKLTKRRT